MQAEIDKQLEEHKLGKTRKRKDGNLKLIEKLIIPIQITLSFRGFSMYIIKHYFSVAYIEKEDTDRFVRESNLDIIKSYVGDNVDDPDSDIRPSELNKPNTRLITGLGKNSINFVINYLLYGMLYYKT